MIASLLVFIAAGVVWCGASLTWFIWRNVHVEHELFRQMTAMNETYRLGFEAISHSMDRFEKRLKEVEEEVL